MLILKAKGNESGGLRTSLVECEFSSKEIN